MTNQQIEQASQKHADEQFPRLLDALSTNPWQDVKEFLAQAYKRGAQDAFASQWISVEERLPELGLRVLVYRKQAGLESIFIAKRVTHDTANADGTRWHWTQVVYDSEIKAWLPIPQFNPKK